MVLFLGEPPGSFCDIGCCWFSFIVVLHSLLFLHFRATHSMPPALCPGFSGSWRSQPALSVTLATFDCFCFCYGFEWAFFTHRHFLPYSPSPHLLIQPAFIKASLGAGSSSLKFAGHHADPRNTDPSHLFIWFTSIHNLDIRKNSFLNRTKYYHKLLLVKSLVYVLLTRSELFSLVQSHIYVKTIKKHFEQDLHCL